MRKTRLFLFLAILLCSSKAFALNFTVPTVGGINYTTSSVNTVTVTTGTYSGDIEIPATVEYEGTTYNVTAIGTKAFYGCSEMRSIIIPGSVTSIGNQAFYGCTSLTGITIPNGVTSIGTNVFRGCTGLTSITIQGAVTSIGNSAFYGCTGLTSITIPDAVTSIGFAAFYGCTGLTSITIPSNVTSIGDYAFDGCGNLTSITIPSNVTSIGDYAFHGCGNLTSITIPVGVTSIGSQTFGSCSKLASITIPNNVTSIGAFAFAGCAGLTSIAIPNKVTSIGASAFYGCSKLTSTTIPNSVTSIGDAAFKYCAWTTITSLIENPSGVLGNDVFTKQSGKVATLYIPFGTSSAYGTDWTAQFTTTSEVPAVITVSAVGYATYCSTGNIDFTGSGLEAYLASSYDATTGNLTVTKCNPIPAGEGMLVKGNANTYTFTESCSSAPDVANKFVGTNVDMTLGQTTGDYTNFILGTDGTNAGFYKVSASGTLAAHKAYLPIKTSALPVSGPSKKLVVEFKNENGQTTDIKTVDMNGNWENLIYNLQGQKVENPEHGIYIIKGKKTYIK